MHAEAVIKEIANFEPAFIALFNLEEMLDIEAYRNQILWIYKVYLDKKSVEYNAEVLCKGLFKNESKKKLVLDYFH